MNGKKLIVLIYSETSTLRVWFKLPVQHEWRSSLISKGHNNLCGFEMILLKICMYYDTASNLGIIRKNVWAETRNFKRMFL